MFFQRRTLKLNMFKIHRERYGSTGIPPEKSRKDTNDRNVYIRGNFHPIGSRSVFYTQTSGLSCSPFWPPDIVLLSCHVATG